MGQDDIIAIVREFPDRSIRWLLETPENVRGLLLAIARDIAERLDFKRLEPLRSTFIPETLRKREADLLFLAPFLQEEGERRGEVVIYILIEHQSTPDPLIKFRVLFSMVQIWEGQRRQWEEERTPAAARRFRPILPIVFYTGSRKWEPILDMRGLIEPPAPMEEFIPHHKTLFLNLKACDPEGLVEANHPFGWVLRVVQKEDASLEELEKALGLAIEHLEGMAEEEKVLWDKLMRFPVMLMYHRRSPEEHKELFDLIETSVEDAVRRKEVEKMGKTIAQSLIEEGKEIGIQQGKKLGIHEGRELGVIKTKQDDLAKLLRARFGDSALTAIERVKAIKDADLLDLLFDRALVAKALDELQIED